MSENLHCAGYMACLGQVLQFLDEELHAETRANLCGFIADAFEKQLSANRDMDRRNSNYFDQFEHRFTDSTQGIVQDLSSNHERNTSL